MTKLSFLPLLAFVLAFSVIDARAAAAEERVSTVISSAMVNFGLTNGPNGHGTVTISEQTLGIHVQVPIGWRTSDSNVPFPEASKLGLQVWLLRADGSVVTQTRPLSGPIGIGGMGYMNYSMMGSFTNVPVKDIVAIVLKKEGKLYTEEIKETDWKK